MEQTRASACRRTGKALSAIVAWAEFIADTSGWVAE